MSRLNAEWEAKLAMLKAIARSQEAMARMLESAADVSAAGVPSVSSLREHVRVLTGLQAEMARSVAGVSWTPPKQGRPVGPWLKKAAAVRLTIVGARGDGGSEADGSAGKRGGRRV
ncbi:hypothetical protein SAMN05216312_102362 [Cohnella sp. OV330]|uniref:hypothetical protein n=1 Tax=Cohnella sp. OV330 TaxID=1855288 RepID=UPI0008E0F06E|nr:hypothetical protein [Cohnella sp. OV330]SFA93633.1 hypothetical protein SAMN05216312_102362 [Cohnella sp. OV330]